MVSFFAIFISLKLPVLGKQTYMDTVNKLYPVVYKRQLPWEGVACSLQIFITCLVDIAFSLLHFLQAFPIYIKTMDPYLIC